MSAGRASWPAPCGWLMKDVRVPRLAVVASRLKGGFASRLASSSRPAPGAVRLRRLAGSVRRRPLEAR